MIVSATNMQEVNAAVAIQIDFELCSLIFLFFFLIASFVRKRARIAVSGNIGLMTLLISVSEILEITAMRALQNGGQTLRLLLCTIMLAVMCIIPVLFSSFFVRRRQNESRREILLRLVNLLPVGICLISIFVSVWNRYVFYVDAKGFHAGKLFWIFYLNYVLYAVSAIVHTLRHKRHRRVSLPISIAILTAGALPALFGMLLPDFPVYCFCMTCVVFLAVNGEEQNYRFTDTVSGALNREAFLFSVQEAEEQSQQKHLFAIGMDNFKLINEMYTVEGGNQIMRQLVAALQAEFGRQRIYRLGGDMFALIVPGDTECPRVLDDIRKIFEHPFKAGGRLIRLSACIGVVHSANHSTSELVTAMEYALSQAKNVGKGEIFEAVADTADEMKRRKAIETAMMENIQQQRFEVHYQPIYDAKKKKFHSMEALARLNVPGYGYVSPEEFIRIAEKNGTILQIGLLVLEEVCRFIVETDLGSRGIEYVEVNLSVVQCTHDLIYSSIREVLRKYNVPPEMLNLELTESAAAYSEKKLIRNLARMSLMNLSFSLDDYGSGYSNINYIVTLPFTIAKIDKYLVWAAAKSATSRLILEHIIAMFRAIHLKVVTEGIEDAEMADMVIRMGADFLQGYYYSKPVPKELLLERLEDSYIERFQ